MTDAAVPPPGSAGPQPQETFLFVDGSWDLEHTFHRDPLAARFLAGLAERRLLGVADPASNRVYFPPHSQWDEPYAELAELVEVGPGGVIRTLTSLPGRNPEDESIVIVHVQLDGADSAAPGRLRGPLSDPDDPLVLIGARCHAVFADRPVGDWNDYWYELGG